MTYMHRISLVTNYMRLTEIWLGFFGSNQHMTLIDGGNTTEGVIHNSIQSHTSSKDVV